MTTPLDGTESAVLDAVTLAIIEGTLNAAIRSMSEVLIKTARSPIIAIAEDFSNAIFSAAGEQVAMGDDQPVHVGSMQETTRRVIEYWAEEVSDGDVYFVNDPTFGVGHLQDMTMMKPLFHEGTLIAWLSTRAHVADVGGSVAGGYNPEAREIYAEGLRLPPVRLCTAGRLNKDVIDLVCMNVRTGRAQRGDMGAQLGALGVAADRIQRLCRELTADVVVQGITELVERGETFADEAIGKLPEGTWHGSSVVENPRGGAPLKIDATVEIAERTIRVLLHSPPAVESYINSYHGNTQSAVYAAALTALPKDIPHNGGAYRRIIVDPGEPGTLVNAGEPSPCSLATSTPFDSILEAVQDALSQAVPERTAAGWAHLCGSAFSGTDPRTGEPYSYMATFSCIGGAGATWSTDGWSCCGPQCTFGAMKTGNIEEIEFRVPIRIDRFELEPDSEGPGEWRGGFGVGLEVTPAYGPVTVSNFGDGTELPPPSRHQDEAVPGSVFSRSIRDANGVTSPVQPHSVMRLEPGQTLLSASAGGGGIGDPARRSRPAVARDVEDGLISRQRANKVYGVNEDD